MTNLARDTEGSFDNAESSIINHPIDYSVPYKSRQNTATRHFGFFPFFAKKPWQVVQAYIKHFTLPGDLVCDPFVGSGVTAVEALVLGRRAIAGDINPVARFITRTTAIAPVAIDKLNAAFYRVRDKAQNSIEALSSMSDSEVQALLADLKYPTNEIPLTIRRNAATTVDQLHTPRQLAGLTLLRDAIAQESEPIIKDMLLVALANTVRYTNRTYSLPAAKEGEKRRAPYRGNAGFLRRFSYSFASESLFYEHAVWMTFERVYSNVVKTKIETNNLINGWYSNNFAVTDSPASRIHEITGEEKVDYFFTDPPYSNDIYFVDLSTLWAAWLGLEIPETARRDELLIGGSQNKSRAQFETEFAAAMESISKALKRDHWFTLVYKHSDLNLWQKIVEACESSGLQYVNSVWQNITFSSTRQIENPNLIPSGDMYLNFRKMSRRIFQSIYGLPEVALPTLPNYVEHEIERIIVAYLGADIKLITSSVIQQILDSRAFRNFRDNPTGLSQNIMEVLKSPRFITWKPREGETQWVLAPGYSPDVSLPAIDRARYIVFDLLRQAGEITVAEVRRHLLVSLADTKIKLRVYSETALLRNAAVEISPHKWRFDVGRVVDYKQLRLLFAPSVSDEIRERLEAQSNKEQSRSLRPNLESIGLLRDRLREANVSNGEFDGQYTNLMVALESLLQKLQSQIGEKIDKVLAVGEWAEYGIDLRNLPFDEVTVKIVLLSNERPFALYWQIAKEVFAGLDSTEVTIQFTLETQGEWERAQASTLSSVTTTEPLELPILERL